MQSINNTVIYSASDLVAYMGCKHRTVLDLKKLAGWDEKCAEPDAACVFLQ